MKLLLLIIIFGSFYLICSEVGTYNMTHPSRQNHGKLIVCVARSAQKTEHPPCWRLYLQYRNKSYNEWQINQQMQRGVKSQDNSCIAIT
jgi:hypothetical protein